MSDLAQLAVVQDSAIRSMSDPFESVRLYSVNQGLTGCCRTYSRSRVAPIPFASGQAEKRRCRKAVDATDAARDVIPDCASANWRFQGVAGFYVADFSGYNDFIITVPAWDRKEQVWLGGEVGHLKGGQLG